VDYLNLREAVPFMATWDDHDYGQSDGGSDNPDKAEARRVFSKYWSYTKNLIPADQPAIYHSRIVGEKNRRVQFIILDTRSERSNLLPNIVGLNVTASSDTTPSPVAQPIKMFLPNQDPKARILSDAQWRWLDGELKKPAELRILVSSIQILANEAGFEKWGNFPLEREKFLNMVQKNKLKNLVILSGDRHHASISKMPMKSFDLYDVTGSSLNKISKATEPEVDPLYTAPSYLGINFGHAEIDWAKKQVEFQIIGEDNKVQLSQIVKF
jgi:alkaline phosphatase D